MNLVTGRPFGDESGGGGHRVIQFRGMQVPGFNLPLIELETVDGEVIDLYNDCHLVSVGWSADALAFVFTAVADGRSVSVTFEGVRHLSVVQPDDWVAQESTQIDHLLIRPDGPWRRVVFKAGGLEYEFDCAAIELAPGR
jgi:hypothetical protein